MTDFRERIGFMQGRLSPQIDGKIQAFPWTHWESEFEAAHNHDWRAMEWTMDSMGFEENPFNTVEGQKRILELSKIHRLRVWSVTCDNVLQRPYFKKREDYSQLQEVFQLVDSSAKLGAKILVIPFLDGSTISTELEEDRAVGGMLELVSILRKTGVRIAFESDYAPEKLRSFIARFPEDCFGINYDIGNSASLGFSPLDEFKEFGRRVIHVHIKDRILGGTTVPLGQGSAKFSQVFEQLRANAYEGWFVFQTARAPDGAHALALDAYRTYIETIWKQVHVA